MVNSSLEVQYYFHLQNKQKELYMFKFLLKRYENEIYELADRAVKEAEIFLGSGKGKEKKQIAIDFVLRYLPLPPYLIFLKPLINKALNSLIDKAVGCMTAFVPFTRPLKTSDIKRIV